MTFKWLCETVDPPPLLQNYTDASPLSLRSAGKPLRGTYRQIFRVPRQRNSHTVCHQACCSFQIHTRCARHCPSRACKPCKAPTDHRQQRPRHSPAGLKSKKSWWRGKASVSMTRLLFSSQLLIEGWAEGVSELHLKFPSVQCESFRRTWRTWLSAFVCSEVERPSFTAILRLGGFRKATNKGTAAIWVRVNSIALWQTKICWGRKAISGKIIARLCTDQPARITEMSVQTVFVIPLSGFAEWIPVK